MPTNSFSLKPIVDNINELSSSIRQGISEKKATVNVAADDVVGDEKAVMMLDGVAQILEAFCRSACQDETYLCVKPKKPA
jgi:hypothetical protein